MNERTKRAAEDLPDLREFLRNAMALAESLLSAANFRDDDHLAFAGLALLSKLDEQAGAVDLLVSQGFSRDAELVARSMIECSAIVLWVARDPATRPLQWRSFAAVHDWRLLQRRKAEGAAIDAAEERMVEDAIRKYGHLHEDPGLKGKDAADPYHWTWRGNVTVRAIFDEIDGDTLYRDVYGPSSDWIHSGVEAVGKALSRGDAEVAWNPPPPETSAAAYAAAFQAVIQALLLVAAYLNAAQEREARELVNDYKAHFVC